MDLRSDLLPPLPVPVGPVLEFHFRPAGRWGWRQV